MINDLRISINIMDSDGLVYYLIVTYDNFCVKKIKYIMHQD